MPGIRRCSYGCDGCGTDGLAALPSAPWLWEKLLANVTGYDVIHANLPTVPAGAQLAGYTTGTPDIQWTAKDWATHPGSVRICQDAGATDTTADVLDVEPSAATNTQAASWYAAALASYEAGTRPGQRYPCLYTSQSNVTPLVDQLNADGVSSGPRLWVADWGIGLAAAENMLANSGGPFPVVGVQYQNGATYDYNVWLDTWLGGSSSMSITIPGVPGAWLSVQLLSGTDGTQAAVGLGLDGTLWTVAKPPGGAWGAPTPL